MSNDEAKTPFAEAIEAMNRDLAYFEEKCQGRFSEAPHIGYGNRKTRCVNEATLPIITCHPSFRTARVIVRTRRPSPVSISASASSPVRSVSRASRPRRRIGGPRS